ncbi:MAG: hypothetical protein IKP00_07740 [Victivallales bacterium]|nr:hypothetical protein [Victivallales bacterium]
MRKVLLSLCCAAISLFGGIREELAKMPDEAVEVVYQRGAPFFKIGGTLYPPVLYNYSTDGHYDHEDFTAAVRGFVAADIKLFSFGIEAVEFWKGPNQYDYDALENALHKAFTLAPEGRFIFAITFCHGPAWWHELYPEEQIQYAVIDENTSPRDCIGNYVCHSFASERWRKESSETVRKLVEYIESTPYAKHIFGYRIGDGVYSEWIHFGMKNAMPDVGPAMTTFFRKYLSEKYNGDVKKLSQAWNQPQVTFKNATPPPVEVRLQYIEGSVLRDPRNAWEIDFLQCMQRSIRDLLLSMNKAAKDGCKGRKLVGNYCGYFFGQTYTPNGWQVVTDEILDSPYVDFMIAPTCYSYNFRKVGQSQLARSLVASYPLHKKFCIIEADTRTHLWGLKKSRDGSRYATNAQESVALLARDMAQAISRGSVYWYYDLAREWYNCPEILDFFKKIVPVYNSINDFSSSAEIAVIADWESVYYHAAQYIKNDPVLKYIPYYAGRQVYSSINYMTNELTKSGLVFDAYSFGDIDNKVLDKYKIYIFPQLFYMTPEKLAKLAKLKKEGKTLIFMNQAGWLTPKGPNADSIFKTTGIHADILPQMFKSTVTLKDGALMDADAYGDKSADFMPTLKVTDPQADILGTVRSGSAPVDTYAKKVFEDGPTVYLNGSSFISGPELRRIAQEAGVHIYCDSDKGIVFANNSMVSFHTATPGTYTLKAKSPVKWTMVYPQKQSYPNKQTEITFSVNQPDTVIFVIKP